MKDPAREVQCHLMIGLCCLEKGQVTEAIGHFKKGLYVEGHHRARVAVALLRARTGVRAAQRSARGALLLREGHQARPRFRDVEKRIEALRGGSAREERAARSVERLAATTSTAAFDLRSLGDDPRRPRRKLRLRAIASIGVWRVR